jgi:hypothetical protein
MEAKEAKQEAKKRKQSKELTSNVLHAQRFHFMSCSTMQQLKAGLSRRSAG